MSLKNRKRATAGLALFCTAALGTTGAVAAPEVEHSIHVRYVAADLGSQDAATALYARIKRAARVVCDQPNVRELADYARFQACYDRAVDKAVANVNAGTLTALHRSKTQRLASG